MKTKVFILIAIILLFIIPKCVYASNAEDISKKVIIKSNNQVVTKLNDDKTSTKLEISANSEIKITSENNIGSIYIKYEKISKQGILQYGNKQIKLGEHGFLHEYVKLEDDEENIKEIILKYNEKVQISEIYCFTKGEVPSWVQVWKTQQGDVDLMLFSTHSDDEHLFFAGLLPTYVDKGYNVQVIYLTNHNDNPARLHEQLDGLWNVGVTNYPIIGKFPDAFSDSLKGAIENLKKAGYTEDDVIKFQAEQIRKFKPLVIVGHDENGEYNHGQHMLNCDGLKQAIVKSSDENFDKETVQKYGIWETPKVYLHLYEKNPIVMNYDISLNSFNGKTAYEISKVGYSFHASQQYTWFTKWLKGPDNSFISAKQITKYSPTSFGLYYTSVGEDIKKDDMFENIDKTKYRPNQTKEEKKLDESIINVKEEKSENNNLTIYGAAIIVGIIGFIAVFRRKSIAKKR